MIPNFTNFKIDPSKFTIIKQLGDGTYSTVFLVENVEDGKNYTLKKLKPHGNTEYDKYFSREINIMIRLNHPSLLKFYGYSIDGKAVSILMQYAQNGSLRNILDNPIPGYDNTAKQKILIGVARGMMYLHKNMIIHRNLKPENIFLDANFNPLIGDFGLSRSSEERMSIMENVKAPLYTAPEIFVDNENYDESVDVFSYGIMMYEIVTGLVPYPKKILKSKFVFMKNVIGGRIRPSFPEGLGITNELKLLIEKCWSTNSVDRPTFEEIFSMLAYDSSEPTDFVNLFQSENLKYYLEDVNQDEIQSYVEDLLDRENTEQYSIKQSIDQLKQQVDSIQQDNESTVNKIKENEEFDDQKMICPSCNHEIMKKSEILYKSGFKYHKECVKCAICGESLKSDEDFGKFVCVTPGLFFCEEDYEKYQVTRHLEKRVLNEYRDKMIKNLIKEIFSPLICNNEEGPFFDENVMQDSLFMSKYYKYFVPTVTFHFSFSPNEIKMSELVQIIPSDMIIVYIEKGSTFLTLAFTLAKELESESNSILQLMCSSKVNSIKEELLKKQELGNLIVGNLIGKPVIKFPTDDDIKEALNDKAINFLQSTEIFDEEIDFEGIRKKVQSFLREEYYMNLKFIKDNYKIYEDAENKVQQDILNNEFEMVIINETIIANNYMKKYERIKQSIIKMLEEHESDDIIQKTASKDNQDEDDIPKKQKRKDKNDDDDDDINANIQKEKNANDVDDDDDNFLEEEEEEEFNKPENEVVLPDNGCDKWQKEPIEINLYHGSNSANHKSIIINHFYRAGNKKVKRLDQSYFGKGIYATDNIFYATGYSNDCNILRFNEKASVFCCQAIYNPKHSKLANEINAESMYLSRDTIMNYGVHQAIVGSGYNYHSIDENQIEDHLVVATEFVFPKKYQLIPIFVFTVMRKEFSILWVDESNKYNNEMMELKQKTIDNIYYLNTIEKLDEIVDLKKKNSIKLILCFENKEFGKDVINNAKAKINRPMKIIHRGKNIRINRKLFVLVFSKDQNQIEFVKPFKNVVFTNKIEDVEHFVSKDMKEGFV